MDELIAIFQDGGMFMWPILGCGVFGAAICTERLAYLYLYASVNTAALVSQVQKHVMADHVDSALRICNVGKQAALPHVLKVALMRADDPDSDIHAAVQEGTLEVGPWITSRVSYLSMLANVSTLLGLLGTIQGLIMAFDAVGGASAETRQALLAQGISVAMYTTFFGLVVAVPIMVCQAFIQARANRILDEVDEHGLRLANLLMARRRSLDAAHPRRG